MFVYLPPPIQLRISEDTDCILTASVKGSVPSAEHHWVIVWRLGMESLSWFMVGCCMMMCKELFYYFQLPDSPFIFFLFCLLPVSWKD